jgi:hypothetical protein
MANGSEEWLQTVRFFSQFTFQFSGAGIASRYTDFAIQTLSAASKGRGKHFLALSRAPN